MNMEEITLGADKAKTPTTQNSARKPTTLVVG